MLDFARSRSRSRSEDCFSGGSFSETLFPFDLVGDDADASRDAELGAREAERDAWREESEEEAALVFLFHL